MLSPAAIATISFPATPSYSSAQNILCNPSFSATTPARPLSSVASYSWQNLKELVLNVGLLGYQQLHLEGLVSVTHLTIDFCE